MQEEPVARPQTSPPPQAAQPQPVAQPMTGQGAVAQPQGAAQAATLAQRRAATKRRPVEDVHLDELLEIVVHQEASDLHLAVGLPPVMRIDGALRAMNYEPLSGSVLQRMVYDVLSDEQVQRFETNLELDFSYALQKVARFRCNIFRDKGEVAAAFRLIPTRIPTIDELLLPKVCHELVKLPRGFVLVTGPTGSGKSTTLAAMVNEINETRHEHIITIEDPIEYLHNHRKSIVNQRELGHDTWKFENALRSALREDPDVLLVGEMRDLETMALAITCAETGHLVFATLHTNNAAESIDRMIDVFPPGQQDQIRVQLSNNLAAVLSQQLLPRAGQPGRGGGSRGDGGDRGDPQPDPRGEGAPDNLHRPDQRRVRDADHGPGPARPLPGRADHLRSGDGARDEQGGAAEAHAVARDIRPPRSAALRRETAEAQSAEESRRCA
jgi:twitching motility protein PilT